MKISSLHPSNSIQIGSRYTDPRKYIDTHKRTRFPLTQDEWLTQSACSAPSDTLDDAIKQKSSAMLANVKTNAGLGESLFINAQRVYENKIAEQYANGALKHKLVQNHETGEATIYTYDPTRKPVSVANFSKDGASVALKTYINGNENLYRFKNGKMNSMIVGLKIDECDLVAEFSDNDTVFGNQEIVEVYKNPKLSIFKKSKFSDGLVQLPQFDSYYRFVNGDIKVYSAYDGNAGTYLKHVIE